MLEVGCNVLMIRIGNVWEVREGESELIGVWREKGDNRSSKWL